MFTEGPGPSVPADEPPIDNSEAPRTKETVLLELQAELSFNARGSRAEIQAEMDEIQDAPVAVLERYRDHYAQAAQEIWARLQDASVEGAAGPATRESHSGQAELAAKLDRQARLYEELMQYAEDYQPPHHEPSTPEN